MEAETAETFEGEMDKFQTPLVRCGHRPFFLRVFNVVDCSAGIQFSSLVPLVRTFFPFC
jgi:hypothetical protein